MPAVRYFFGRRADYLELLEGMFANPGWALLERFGQPRKKLRTFHTLEALVDAYPLAKRGAHLLLWTPGLGGPLHSRRVRPTRVKPYPGFHDVRLGAGLIHLSFGVTPRGVVRRSQLVQPSQVRARHLTPAANLASWNWPEVARVFRQLDRLVLSLSVTTYPQCTGMPPAKGQHRWPVLRHAAKALAAGKLRLEPY